jgi:hypothetical protein
MKTMTLLTLLTFLTAAVLAGPVKTPGMEKPRLVAEAAMKKAEKAGTVLTQAQIDALVDQGKTKEAMKAFFAREAKAKEVEAAEKAKQAEKKDK